jgi:hypothetical protein
VVLGDTPGVEGYKAVSTELPEAGEDVEPFSRLYRFFGRSWPRAREALKLSGQTSERRLEARLKNRRLGKIARYIEDTLRDAITSCVEHYARPPSVTEYSWWREQK